MSSMNKGLELSARSEEVENLLTEKRTYFVTPDFQRPYQWTEDELGDLWNDLIDATDRNSNHFLGQVILVPEEKGERSTLKIIDGQQRLASISILASVLRDYFIEKGQKEAASPLAELLEVEHVGGGKRRRLELSEKTGDDENYKKIYESNGEKSDGRIGKAYDFFCNKIESISLSKVQDVRTTLLTEVTLIRTVPADVSSAYRVFQTENNRGKELDPIDLIKSLVLEAASNDSESEVETVKNNWMDIVTDLDTLLQAGAKRPLMHIIGLSDFRFPFHRNSTQRFIDDFQHLLDEELDKKGWSVEQFTQWLIKESGNYLTANTTDLDPEHSYCLSFDKLTRKSTRLTSRVRVKNPHAGVFLYYIWKRFDEGKEFNDAMRLASIVNARILLEDRRSSNERRDKIQKIVRRSIDNPDIHSVITKIIKNDTISDTALRETVAERGFLQNKFTKIVLAKVEQDHFNSGDSRPRITDFQTEHIAPVKSFSDDRYTSWRPVFNHDEDKFDRYVDRIGNITMLESSQNQRAGSDPFDEKLREYRTSEYKMTNSISDNYNCWGYNEIKERSEHMADLIVKSWSL